MLVFILAAASALVFSFLCSISEAVLLSVRHSHIQALGKTKGAIILRRFKDEIDVPIAAILILNTVAHTVGASVAGASYGEAFDPNTLWIFTAIFTTAILLFTEIIPKTLGVVAVQRLAVPVAYCVRLLTIVLSPVLVVTRAISGLLRRGNEAPVTSLEEIRLLVSLGRTEGVVGAGVAEMIEGATALKRLRARDVMVPRGGVVYLSGRRSLEENVELLRRSGHSRFPYTPTGNLDDITGIILAKDLLFWLRDYGNDVSLEEIVTKAVVVPTTAPLDKLLRTFQGERRHLAVVVDEYGGTQGVVTLEDVIEEIVGDIEDESDRLDSFIIKRADGSLLCRGWAEARKVLEALDVAETDLEDFEAVSVGGLVAELLGHIPAVGDRVEWRDLRFTVLQASPRRAERVDVIRLRKTTPAPEEPEGTDNVTP